MRVSVCIHFFISFKIKEILEKHGVLAFYKRRFDRFSESPENSLWIMG